FIVFLQLDFIRSKDLGADINQTIVLPNPDIIDSTMQARVEFFKNELLKNQEITYVVSSTSIPGKPDNIIQGGLSRLEKSDEDGVNHYNFGIDRHFIEAYRIKVIAGRNFSSLADEQSVIINKTAMYVLGYKQPDDAIGQKIKANWTPERTVIGVVEDFHQQSLRSSYDPIVFSLDDSGEWGYYSVKLNPASKDKSLSDVISVINDTWSKSFPGNPFDYFFLDEYFNEQYKDDLRFGKVLNVFSVLTLFVACLGILGLSIFSASQRTKEIGVRKVLGASASNILLLLSGDYVKMILIALFIAVPFTYYFIVQWLDGFAYHITVQWWMLIIPGILVLIIALLAVSSQSVKAALTNPAKSLNS
ncbi:MAG: ABC transporter permease, partial [Marivirga sp.]|nr:ABC transporter permease [Marivirga sp.]